MTLTPSLTCLSLVSIGVTVPVAENRRMPIAAGVEVAPMCELSGDRRDGGFHNPDFPALMHNHHHVAFDVLEGRA